MIFRKADRQMKKLHIGNIVIGEGLPKVCVPIVAEDIDEMIKVADDLLYAVKAESKGTYKFFEEQEQK